MDQKDILKFDRICAWCGPAFVILFVLLWGYVGQNLPNPSPALSPTELADRYLNNLSSIRIGFISSLIVIVLYMAWTSLLSSQMSRIEGTSRTLTYLQLIGGALTVMVVSFSAMYWCVAAFRPERTPELFTLLTDTGWLCIDLQYPCTQLQMWALAIVALHDRSKTPLLPRWACWLTIWAAISFFPASLTGVMKIGPFAWNGVLSYYFPYFCWLCWFSVTSFYMIKEVNRRIREYKTSSDSQSFVPQSC